MTSLMMQVVASRRVGYKETIAALNPVAHWPLDDQAGTIAQEFMRGLDNGTYVNAPTLNVDPLIVGEGSGVRFTAASFEGIGVPHNARLDLLAAHTILAWINVTNDANEYAILNKINVADFDRNLLFQILDTSSVLRSTTRNSTVTSVDGTSDASDGTTHFASATLNAAGDTARVYFDGLQEGINSSMATGNPALGPLDIGQRTKDSSRFIDGTMDSVSLFDRELSGGTIAMLFRLGNGQDVSPGDYISG